MAASLSGVRWWRTAFLTLRDETLASPLPPIAQLLQNLIFSHSQSLVSAASDLPPHEVASDLLFLLEFVAANACHDGDAQDMIPISTHTCILIHDVCHRVSLQINSSSWTVILDSFAKLLDFLLRMPGNKPLVSLNAKITPVMECLETIRRLTTLSHRKPSLSENIHLVNFLLHIIACLHSDLIFSYRSSSGNQGSSANVGKKFPRYSSIWEVQSLAFTMLGEAFSAFGSSFPPEICQSTVEVLRKVMDVLASETLLVEDNAMSRFYASLLHCLHVVLIDLKCSISGHVSSFVAVLQMFFIYGLTSRPQLSCPDVHKGKELGSAIVKLTSTEPKKTDHTPYRPPHMRKKDILNVKQAKSRDSQSFSDSESSVVDLTSDSDYSDSDGSLKDSDSGRSSKVRVAAIICLQDLCQADPKSFATQWTILLPTNDVLKPRKFEATLMSCLIFDPSLKAQMASASTLAAMMDGHSSIFMQVAEYKESAKYGSFMALSSSLGLILMQLHTGILYLIQRETQSRLLTPLFKILMLLISCTPYSRMPGELLPRVITSLRSRIEEGFPFRNDQTGLLVGAISCLAAALSTSPSQPQVREMLSEEILTGFVEAERTSGVLLTIFQFSEHLTSPTTCFEALQALRAVSHNYPNLMPACWQRVSAIVYKLLRAANPEVSARTWKGQIGNTIGFIGEKVIAVAIKVLDECLRGISGFKGTEDLLDDKLYDTPFTSDCIRTKKVSSAPSYGLENPEDVKEEPKASQSGSEQWSEAIEKHIPLVLRHTSAMVRAASVTCFAGITSSVFFSLTKEKKGFIISSVISAALRDEAPPVRSAACRAIGVISCFPEISQSSETLEKFIHAVETNTRDPLVSVRITASWALANVCDSVRHCIDDFPLEQSRGSNVNTPLIDLLTECALHLTKDGDKVKSNAVRALGNISRFVRVTSSGVHNKPLDCTGSSLTTNNVEVLPSGNLKGSHGYVSNSYHPASLGDSRWLEKMVQAFLSCVTTGNVKVQWNVCHAFSNLFLNETIEVQDMDWAPSVFSILLLLLRDSSNFKIRIQAAAALAVPASALDYGKSFSDVVQGVEHILENLGSDQVSAPSNFKYRVMLEKQLTSTMLHVLRLASSTDHQPLKDFLVKKASFLEEWFKMLCSSLGETQPEVGSNSVGSQKKEMISKAIQSLTEVYEGRNHHSIAQKFKKLESSI